MDTKQKVEGLYKLDKDLKDLLEKESDLYKKAMEDGDNVVKYNDVDATEAELWEEVRVTGLEGDAGKLIGEKYPELFDAARAREAKNKEQHDFVLTEFGFNFHQMSLADYMKITETIIEYKMSK